MQAAFFMGHAILIIDDDIGVRRLLDRALESDGYATVTAENGAEGVRRLVEQKPCVIVLDFDMPVMDGHDFREVQKRVAPEVPIICITGTADGERVARRVGASSVHLKPFDVGALCDTIAKLCRLPHTHRHTAEMEACIERDWLARVNAGPSAELEPDYDARRQGTPAVAAARARA